MAVRSKTTTSAGAIQHQAGKPKRTRQGNGTRSKVKARHGRKLRIGQGKG